jgi:hypothetical protein
MDNSNKLDTNRDSLAFSSTDFQNQTNEIGQQTLDTILSPNRNNFNEKSANKSVKNPKGEQVGKSKKPFKKSATYHAELPPALNVSLKRL